jgi:hypothetical protein
MTLGELLDAAVVVLRRRAVLLLVASGVLAAGEQLALVMPRAAAYLSPPFYGPADNHVADWWAVTSTGLGVEGAIITILAAPAGAAAAAMLTGNPRPGMVPAGRAVAIVVAAAVFGVCCGLGAYLGFVPWIVLYGVLALAGPVIAIEGGWNPAAALGRSAALAIRSGLRGWRILLAGYLTWFGIRVALGVGWTEVTGTVFAVRPAWQIWLAPMAWALADTVAYAALACLSAVLVLDIRMRTEGLDIMIGRARSRGEDPAATLAHLR